MNPIAREVIRRSGKEIFRRPERLNVWEWAEKNRKLPKSVTAKPGRYRTANAPYQRAPQEAIEDDDVQLVVLWWGARLGKTEIFVNLVGATMDINPRAILVAYPTEMASKNFSKKFFVPMYNSTPCLQGKLLETRTKNANNTLLYKEFPGGNISIVTAGSINSFRQVQAPIILLDEIDAMEDTKEGDPVILGLKRADNYRDGIKMLSSTATIKGLSRIEMWFEKSDKQMWFCPCPKCKAEHVPDFDNLIFKDRNIADAGYVCPSCKVEINAAEYNQMILSGRWKATADFRGIRGYWMDGMCSPFPASRGFKTKLHQFAAEFLIAEAGGEATFKAWWNTFRNRSWEVKGESIEYAPLWDRRELYLQDGKLPAGALVLTCFVDVQKEPARLEATVYGWGIGEECWGLEHRVIFGDSDKPETWDELDAFISQTWLHPSGTSLSIACCLVDMGFNPRAVLKFTKRRQARMVYAAMGARQAWQPPVSRPKKSTIKEATVFTIGADTLKERIFARLKLEKTGPRFIHFPIGQGFDEEFFKQLAAEKLVEEKDEKGVVIDRYYQKTRQRNEALDILVGNFAALDVLPKRARVNFEAIAKSLQVAPESPKEATIAGNESPAKSTNVEKPPVNPAKVFKKTHQGGFVGRWRRGF